MYIVYVDDLDNPPGGLGACRVNLHLLIGQTRYSGLLGIDFIYSSSVAEGLGS